MKKLSVILLGLFIGLQVSSQSPVTIEPIRSFTLFKTTSMTECVFNKKKNVWGYDSKPTSVKIRIKLRCEESNTVIDVVDGKLIQSFTLIHDIGSDEGIDTVNHDQYFMSRFIASDSKGNKYIEMDFYNYQSGEHALSITYPKKLNYVYFNRKR